MALLRGNKSLAARQSRATKRRNIEKCSAGRGWLTKAKEAIDIGGNLKYVGKRMRQKMLDLLFGECEGESFILPPMTADDEKTKKKTIVLDLDETLVHSSEHPMPCYDFTIQFGTRSKEIMYVLKRPGVDQLLNELGKKFEIVLFTAGVKEYADAIVDRLDPQKNITHRLYRDSCSLISGMYVKDLSILGRDLSRTVIVDDNPNSYMLHPRNALPVPPFRDNLSDTALATVISFFKAAYNYRDMRIALWLYLPADS